MFFFLASPQPTLLLAGLQLYRKQDRPVYCIYILYCFAKHASLKIERQFLLVVMVANVSYCSHCSLATETSLSGPLLFPGRRGCVYKSGRYNYHLVNNNN